MVLRHCTQIDLRGPFLPITGKPSNSRVGSSLQRLPWLQCLESEGLAVSVLIRLDLLSYLAMLKHAQIRFDDVCC